MLSFKATTYAVCPVFNILSAVNGYVMINNNFERKNPPFNSSHALYFTNFRKVKRFQLWVSKPQGLLNLLG